MPPATKAGQSDADGRPSVPNLSSFEELGWLKMAFFTGARFSPQDHYQDLGEPGLPRISQQTEACSLPAIGDFLERRFCEGINMKSDSGPSKHKLVAEFGNSTKDWPMLA